MKILIALHNFELLGLVCDCIRVAQSRALNYAENWNFLGVGNSTDALKAIHEATPAFNCLFADINLRPDGITTVIADFKEKSPIHKIILTTGGGLSKEDVKDLQLWKADFLAKPFTPGELISTFRAAEPKINLPPR